MRKEEKGRRGMERGAAVEMEIGKGRVGSVEIERDGLSTRGLGTSECGTRVCRLVLHDLFMLL